MNKKLKISIALFAIFLAVTIISAALSYIYTFTIRFPQSTETGVIPGRLCAYGHSSINYSGMGVFVNGSYDPYQCVADNGSFICIGPLGSEIITDQNGTLISKTVYALENATWIEKGQSGCIVLDWSFGVYEHTTITAIADIVVCS